MRKELVEAATTTFCRFCRLFDWFVGLSLSFLGMTVYIQLGMVRNDR